MNVKKYINYILIQLSEKYSFNLIEITTYKKGKKFKTIKLVIYKYEKEDTKKYYKTIEFKNEIDLLEYLKEMV